MENAASILFVEDDYISALVEKAVLESYGYRVTHVLTGLEAVGLVVDKDWHFDLLLVDIDLGQGMSGIELARIILTTHQVPILFLSSCSDSEVINQASETGAYGFIEKGGNRIVLNATIKMALRLDAATQALKEEQEKLASVIRNSPDMVIQTDMQGIATYVSSQCERITGYPISRFAGSGMPDILHPDCVAGCAAEWSHIYEGGGSIHEHEYRIITADNCVRWVSHSASIIEVEGRAIGVHNVVRDITEKKKTDEDLREKNRLLSETQRIAKVGGWAYDTHNNRMTWCDETYLIHGFEPGELIAGSPEHIEKSIECYDPDDRPVIAAAFNDCCEHGKEYDLEFPLTRKDSRKIRIRTRAVAESVNGKVVKVLGTISDITDQHAAREQERQARLIWENIQIGLHLYHLEDMSDDHTLRMLYANPASETLTGISSEILTGKTIDENFPALREQGIVNKYAEVVRTKIAVSWDEIVYGDKRVPEAAFLVKAFPLPNNCLGVAFDNITERKQAEAEREEMNRHLEQIQRLDSLGILAGGIAHDFNNLLGGIFGYIDLASEVSTEPKVMNCLKTALGAMNRARSLTGQLLTFAKGGEPIKVTGPLFPFIEKTITFALSGSKVAASFSIDSNLWNCDYDKGQIGQVIDNLVINAVQAMPAGGRLDVSADNITIDIDDPRQIRPGDYVCIKIKDCGPGIPAEILPHIFDPFFTTKKTGHGLGLAVCYSIIKRHGGTIEVDSVTDSGTTFNLYLPKCCRLAAVENVSAAPVHKGSGLFLVMDDEQMLRVLISRMLESFGYTVVCVSSGQEAVEFMRKHYQGKNRIAGAIFDLTIPDGVGGQEAVSLIREFDLETPIYVASGYANDPVMAEPSIFGFSGRISKPFVRSELAKLLEEGKR